MEHCLPLPLQRPVAFPYAKSIRHWKMPPVYRQFLEALKEHRNSHAVREFLLVLALGRLHGRQPLEKALGEALKGDWASYRAVKELMPEGRNEGVSFLGLRSGFLANACNTFCGVCITLVTLSCLA